MRLVLYQSELLQAFKQSSDLAAATSTGSNFVAYIVTIAAHVIAFHSHVVHCTPLTTVTTGVVAAAAP